MHDRFVNLHTLYSTHARAHTGAPPAASTASDSGGRFAAWHSLSSLSATLWQPLLSAPWRQPLLSAFFRLRTSCSVAMAWDGLRRTPKSKAQGYRTCRGHHSRRNEPHRHRPPRNDPAARSLQPTNHTRTRTDRQHDQRDKARRHSAQPASQRMAVLSERRERRRGVVVAAILLLCTHRADSGGRSSSDSARDILDHSHRRSKRSRT